MWRVVTEDGRAVTEIGGSLMASWLWHAWYLGMFLCKGTGCSAAVAMPCMRRLCKSPVSSDLDLRHTALGRKELKLDNNVSPAPLYSNFKQWAFLRATQSS